MRGAVLLITSLALCALTPVFAFENTVSKETTSNLDYLDGSGVVIAVADTGIDMDHSCFRNSSEEVGLPGENHRKIVHLNDTIDDWDNQGHQQFRHGTHIAGILACDPISGDENMTSLSSGAKLVVQDIVNSNGWEVPEDVTELLIESSKYGAVINSWSWGDNTVNYTNRSELIDAWTSENPWSLVFVAPGNTGNMMLEPSNSYNVVSVVASDSEENGSLWQSNSHGPDINGRRGTLVAAPGIEIVSANADGSKLSMNNESREMTGTSMATPMAASFTALLQQLIEEEYGYTPSAPLLKAMLAASAEGIENMAPNPIEGYGRPALDSFVNGFYTIDSYSVENWSGLIQSRGSNLSQLISNPWDGSEASGPFLEEGDSWSRFFSPVKGEDLEVVMSYNARTANYKIDDLRLIVHTSDGTFAIDDSIGSSGYSQLYYQSFGGPLTKNSSNETTVMIRLPAAQIEDLDWIKIEVVANDIYNGSNSGFLGLEGTKIGFGLVATGVENLTQNIPPEITMLEGPLGGENYTDNFSIELQITDSNGDDFLANVKLNNTNYSIDLVQCSVFYSSEEFLSCDISIARDLVTYPINRNDWKFEVVVLDNNSSEWTTPKISYFETNNFSIYWTSPMLENNNSEKIVVEDDSKDKNRALLWPFLWVIVGIIVAAGVGFMTSEKKVLDKVPPPFREKE